MRVRAQARTVSSVAAAFRPRKRVTRAHIEPRIDGGEAGETCDGRDENMFAPRAVPQIKHAAVQGAPGVWLLSLTDTYTHGSGTRCLMRRSRKRQN